MKPTREEVLKLMRQASGGILTQVAEDPRCGYEIKVEELQTFAELLKAQNNSDHVDKPLADGAVASQSTGIVPDVRRRAINNVCINGHLNRALDDVLRSNSPDGTFCILGALATNAIDEYIAALGMQPHNNQQNLICKSCGVDRSKEDCKGDRLRCGLAGIAHSDHVAVISAKPNFCLLIDELLLSWNNGPVPETQAIRDRRINARIVLENAIAALQSGISSPSHRPNEQNAVAPDLVGVIEALRNQKQCDEDGILCAVSRQAVDEAIAILSAQQEGK